MTFKFLGRGEGGTSNSAKGRTTDKKPTARADTDTASELGALKLNRGRDRRI